MSDDETLLAVLVAALLGFLGWWWWSKHGSLALQRGQLGPPLPGESATTRGASIATFLPEGAPPPGQPVEFKFKPVAAAPTVAREWASQAHMENPRGTVSVSYSSGPAGLPR